MIELLSFVNDETNIKETVYVDDIAGNKITLEFSTKESYMIFCKAMDETYDTYTEYTKNDAWEDYIEDEEQNKDFKGKLGLNLHDNKKGWNYCEIDWYKDNGYKVYKYDDIILKYN
jgi:hypothetical protein